MIAAGSSGDPTSLEQTTRTRLFAGNGLSTLDAEMPTNDGDSPTLSYIKASMVLQASTVLFF